MATCLCSHGYDLKKSLFDDTFLGHVPPFPSVRYVRCELVYEVLTLLSKAAKAFHRYGGKFEAALVKRTRVPDERSADALAPRRLGRQFHL